MSKSKQLIPPSGSKKDGEMAFAIETLDFVDMVPGEIGAIPKIWLKDVAVFLFSANVFPGALFSLCDL